MLRVKIEILVIALENCKIFFTKTFYRNTFSCLISIVYIILSKIIYSKNSSKLTGKIFASKSLFKQGCKLPGWHFIKKDTGTVAFLRLFHWQLFRVTTLGLVAGSNVTFEKVCSLPHGKFIQLTLFQRGFY